MNSFMDREKVPSEYEANTEILMQVPLFSSAPLESIKILAYLCTRVLFRPGEYVFHAGEIAEFACCIIDGTATMTLGGGGEERVLRKYQGGIFWGGLSLLAEVRHSSRSRRNRNSDVSSSPGKNSPASWNSSRDSPEHHRSRNRGGVRLGEEAPAGGGGRTSGMFAGPGSDDGVNFTPR